MISIAPPPVRHYYNAMSEELAKAVREAMEGLPGSARALALEAGVPQSTVSRILSGERGATPKVTAALAAALARWTDRCEDAERTLRQALDSDMEGGDR